MSNIAFAIKKPQEEAVNKVVSCCKNCPCFDDYEGFKAEGDKPDNGWCDLFNNSTRAVWQINSDCLNNFALNDLAPRRYEKGDLICYIDENRDYTQWQQGNIFDCEYQGRKGWKYYTDRKTGSYREVVEHEICLVDEAPSIHTECEF